MFAPRIRGALLLSAAAVIAACGGGSSDNTGPNNGTTPTAITPVSGGGQVQNVGAALPSPLIVKVTSSSGAADVGATVTFAVTTGTASVSPASATTDANGQAQTTVTLGATAGTIVVTATVTGTTLTTSFTITAGSGLAANACSSGAAQTPAAGGVLPGVAGTGICLSGGTTGADYALVAFNSDVSSQSDIALTPQSFSVHSTGAVALTTPDVAPAATRFAGPTVALARLQATNVRDAFDAHLRLIARTQLAPKVTAARAYMSSHSHASFNVIPSAVTVGQILTLNANGNDGCTNPINVGARVVSISSTAIVVADTANPTGGFTDAEYASFGAAFDTLINPLDTQNFGQPTDIDHNGHILMLFTKEVNRLTPVGTPASEGVVGGFFFDRDLFPTTSNAEFDGCATSNFGEMFYVLVPDPTSKFGVAQNKTQGLVNSTLATLAHEYQHLINAGRRLYINTAADFPEEVWLNEGLSHTAEELLFYRVSGFTPGLNLCVAATGCASSIARDTVTTDQFFDYQGDNLGRYQVFLGMPSRTDVHGQNDNLETRGATWNLLRYLIDHSANPQATTLSQLVNSNTTGLANLQGVFGPTYLTQIRDWATSVFSDDVPGVTDSRFIEQSWNMRDIFSHLVEGTTRFSTIPLQVTPISDAAPPTVSVVAGGTAYLRFTVAAGGKASIDWSNAGLPVSPLIQFTVVRTR